MTTDINPGANAGEKLHIYDHRIKTLLSYDENCQSLWPIINTKANMVVIERGDGSKYINLFDPLCLKEKLNLVLREILFPPSEERQSAFHWFIGGYSDLDFKSFYAIAVEKEQTKIFMPFTRLQPA